jgi:glycosyltransferase involved in cell wall biosynthesis
VRILAIANYLGSRGGLERTQLTMCRELSARGHGVDLLYVTAGDFTEDWRTFADSMTPITGSLPRSDRPLASSAEVIDAVKAARRLHPDVIYVFRYLDVPLAAVVGRLARVPIVLHLCLPQPNFVPLVVRHSLAHLTMTLAVSFDTARNWKGTRIPAESMNVVHTGIDMDLYVPGSAEQRTATRRELGIGPDEFLALYAGRISPEKGIDVLLTACRDVAASCPDFRLIVVGGPSLGIEPAESERYMRKLRDLSGSLDVTWLETRHDVLPLIQTADVALAPSLWPEPFSRSVIEPLACGVPVICSRVGGNPEILTGWLDDYLVPPGDADALAACVRSLYGWRRSDPQLAERARGSVVGRLSLDREVDTVEASLLSVARRRHVAPTSHESALSHG